MVEIQPSFFFVDGRRYRLLNVVDNYNRESFAIKVVTSVPSLRLIRVLDRLVECKGKAKSIGIDNVSDFIIEKIKNYVLGARYSFIVHSTKKPFQNTFSKEKIYQ